MGYHAAPFKITGNSSENEVIPSDTFGTDMVYPKPGKYFLSTGKDYPFCRELNLKITINYAII